MSAAPRPRGRGRSAAHDAARRSRVDDADAAPESAAPDSGVRERLVRLVDAQATDRRHGVEGAAWVAGGAWLPRRG
ncbi:MAG: hypothetical protein JNL38_41335 [Myxococcales bacterium]|nr:hypothetical protein [Myxococcales bacterium]